MAIPKVIHRIWLGGPVPVSAAEAPWRRWQELFPDYQFKTWQEAELEMLGMPAEFHSGRTFAERSDIARLRVLHAEGGVYTDCDATPLRRFDHLWTDRDRLVLFEFQAGEIWNGCLAATPAGVAFLSRYVERNARVSNPEASPNIRTGPVAVAAALSYLQTSDGRGVRVVPPAFLSTAGTDRVTYMNLPEEHPDAVLHTQFRSPPAWAEAPDPAPRSPRPVRDAAFGVRLLPVRIKRRLAR